MTGSWRWNAGFGIGGFVLVFLFSLAHNPLGTTLVRGWYAFVAFWILAYLLRFVLGQMIGPGAEPAAAGDMEDNKGAILDMTTPDDGDLNDLMRSQWTGNKDETSSGFKPLTPKKFVSQNGHSPQDVAQAIRSLTDE